MADHLHERFAASLRKMGIAPDARLAVAVSGGVDSITLAHLAWHNHAQSNLVFLTVDHRLRESATREAEQVAATLRSWGAACEILTWDNAARGSGMQERAREARYHLLRTAARAENCTHVLLGHQADDQAETFWMRLADGSGLTGLAAMNDARSDDDISWVRPLLGMTRNEIAAYARAHALPVIEDPSNRNADFLRVRLRGFAEQLEAEGLTPARLNRTIDKLRDAENALAQIADQLWRDTVTLHPAGMLRIDLSSWAACPRDLRRRVVQRAVMTLSAAKYPPAHDLLVELADRAGNDDFSGMTLAGCWLRPAHGALWVLREPAAVQGGIDIASDAADALVWDRRFAVAGLRAIAGQGVRLAALGAQGWQQVQAAAGDDVWPDAWAGAPKFARETLPAFWQGEKPVAVPQLSWNAADFQPKGITIRPALIV